MDKVAVYGKMLSWGSHCESCKFEERTSVDSPCYECLNLPFISNSKRPFYYRRDKNGKLKIRKV